MSQDKYTKGQQWGALKRAWKGYRIAKAQHDQAKMKEYAEHIRTLCRSMEIDVPNQLIPYRRIFVKAVVQKDGEQTQAEKVVELIEDVQGDLHVGEILDLKRSGGY